MVRLAGWPDGVLRPANSGIYFATGAATLSLPSSWSINSATAVTGLVLEAIQNIESGRIGSCVLRFATPVASQWRILSLVATTVTAPEISRFSTAARMAALTPGILGDAHEASNGRSITME